MSTWAYYCLTYRSPEKRTRMQHRFSQLHMQVKFYEGHHALDPECAPPLDQLTYAINNHMWDAHAWSVLQGHLMIMRDYLRHSDAPQLCVMEDDIHIHKDFLQEQPVIHAQMHKLQLDICLLGYLTPHSLVTCEHMYAPVMTTHAYMEYPDNLYGTQMYVITRSNAERIYSQYGVGSAWHAQVFTHQEFHPADWIITKQGKRACVYPMMAVEEHGGGHSYGDPDQTHWHALCHQAQYDCHTYV